MTFDSLKQTILGLVEVDEADFDPDGDLIDYGLDSIKVFELMSEWKDQGLDVDLARLAETPTLAGWWRLLGPQVEGSR